MTIRKYIFPLAILLSFSFATSISVADERAISFNFWPLVQYQSNPEEGVAEIEALGPFVSWREDSARKQWGIRPFLYWTEDKTESLTRLEFLYPFGKYQVEDGEKKGYFFPLSVYREEGDNGEKKWDFQFFPFFMGKTENGKEYGGLFPIFGTLLERYGKDEIRFYLWPLYGESSSGGVRTTNLFWPFFSSTEGETKQGYRFWPFYGHQEEVGVSSTDFFLWPIFLKQRKGLDTEDPVEERMIFPFYVSKESKNFERKTLFWPFFSHTLNRSTGYEQWDIPWPIFKSSRGEGQRGIKIFPFYGYNAKEGGVRRTFVLYPFYQLEEDRIDDVQVKTTRILLLNRIQTGRDSKGIEKKCSFRIWPFFDYEKDEMGHKKFFLFYLFPFKENGFERNLSPLFRIFRWEKDPRKGISTNLFWGFYKRMKKEELDSWEIAHLVGVKKEKGVKNISFFKGLFQYHNDGTETNIRLFYLPFHIRWSNRNMLNPSSADGGEGG